MPPPPLLKDTPRARADMAWVPAASVPRMPASFYHRYGKRAVDIFLSISILLAGAPIIALAALAVLVTSGWPLFYGAERQGKNGRSFRIWKIRTMVQDADEVLERWRETQPDLAAKFELEFKLQDDPRVTKLGRFLRKSSLDELPQLWNVLRGEMSLVGPRPITEPELRRYGQRASTLLSIRPGLTGVWQIDGRNQMEYPDRIQVELEYCRSAKFTDDMGILISTLAVPFRYNGT